MAGAKVIVTRPAREASRWVDALRAAGLDAMSLPLIRVEPLENPAEMLAARRRAAEYAALMFVSAAAADHFLEGSQPAVGPRFWATGPGTVRALLQAGVPGEAIDAPVADGVQFDSEALWQMVRPQVREGARVLLVRGGDASGHPTGRDWLAREIVAAGGTCDAVAAYRRLAPSFADQERRAAREAATGPAIWLFTSSEAIGHLRRAMPATDWQAARAIATHGRIAEVARNAGFGRVRISQPTLAALVASIESFE